MQATEFFQQPQTAAHKQYEALRAFYVERKSAPEVAQQFGYTLSAFYSLSRDFKQQLKGGQPSQQFFITPRRGRKPQESTESAQQLIVKLRKQYLSVPDIKGILDTLGYKISERTIYTILEQEGFSRLPRRNERERDEAAATVKLTAPKSEALRFSSETFSSRHGTGLLCLLPYLQAYGLYALIEQSDYPQTQSLTRVSAILSFIALKLSNVRRYNADDLWCMDRGLGLFAGLNVLPKAAWFSSYSHSVTRTMNLTFLRKLHGCWQQHGLLGTSANLDFVTIPHWGDAEHLENNWSSCRNQSLKSILAVLAQDPDTGILTYGDTNIRRADKSKVVVEFLDFYRADGSDTLKYLIFDSQFTTYENLKRLNEQSPPIKFITIRKRGKRIVDELNALPKSHWTTLRVPAADGKNRTLQAHEQFLFLKGYDNTIRQVAIAGAGKIKPALIITNDFELPLEQIIRKYARRWVVEQDIAEQIHFFHLNQLSSSMVIKVDFDLTMSILAHNLYRLLAVELPGFSQSTAVSLFEKVLDNGGNVHIAEDAITVVLKKKRQLPLLLSALERFQNKPIAWFQNRPFRFISDTRS